MNAHAESLIPVEGDTKGDGETWEAYAHRLESRIKQQRDHIKGLTELRDVAGDKKARTRIAHLERLLGHKEAQLALHHDGLRALKQHDHEPVEGCAACSAAIGRD